MTTSHPRRLLAVLIASVFASTLSSCNLADADPDATPAPTAAPDVGTLTPSEPTETALDSTPEVQTVRNAFMTLTWARLQKSCSFDGVDVWLDESARSSLCNPLLTMPSEYQSIAVAPAEPQTVTHNDDGSADVLVCSQRGNYPMPSIYTHEFQTPHEMTFGFSTVHLVPADDEHPTGYRYHSTQPSGEECAPAHEITVQKFDNWEQTPLFSDWYDPDNPPDPYAVLPNDGSGPVPRDEMG